MRRYCRRPLDAAGHARNRTLGKIRTPVERSFRGHEAVVRLPPGALPLATRNALQLQLLACAMNLRRALVLAT